MDRFHFFHPQQCSPYQTEKLKIAFLYGIVVCLFGIVGIVFAYNLPQQTYVSIFYKIYSHFSFPFAQIQEIQALTSLILRYSLTDLLSAIILLLFSFSTLNHIVTEVVLAFQGFKFGFLCCLLLRLMDSKPLQSYIPSFFCFCNLLGALILMMCCLRTSYRMANLSFELKQCTDCGRPSFSTASFVSLLQCFIKYCGWILLIKILYCFIIFYL